MSDGHELSDIAARDTALLSPTTGNVNAAP